jgi:hypothetical protein
MGNEKKVKLDTISKAETVKIKLTDTEALRIENAVLKMKIKEREYLTEKQNEKAIITEIADNYADDKIDSIACVNVDEKYIEFNIKPDTDHEKKS